MNRSRDILAVVALAVLIVVFLLVSARRLQAPAAPTDRAVPPSTSGGTNASRMSATSATGRTVVAAGTGLTVTNRAPVDPYVVVERLQDLLDARDFDAALAEARRLLNHADPTVRREVLFALHWIGEAAIPDMVRMMVDPDPDIADQATAFFGMAVENCDGTARRAAALALAADVASKRALDDVLQMLGGLPEQSAAPPIIKLLASGYPEVVAKAQNALWFLSGGETFTNAMQWNAWYRQLPPPEPDPVIQRNDGPAALFQMRARGDPFRPRQPQPRKTGSAP